MGVRLLALATWLILMSRMLVPEQFGWLAGAMGICTVGALLSSAGIPYLFFADAAQADVTQSRRHWDEALGALATLGTSLALIATVTILHWSQAPVPIALVLMLAVVDVVLAGSVQAAGLKLHSVRSFGAASALPALLTVGRAVAACIAVSTGMGLGGYIVTHSLIAFAVVVVTFSWIRHETECRLTPRAPSGATLYRAGSFAAMASSSVALSELDKPLVARVADLTVAGHYALAYRVCAATATPATALAAAMLPRWARLFEQGKLRDLRRSFLLMAAAALLTGLMTTSLVLGTLRFVPPGFIHLYDESFVLMQQLAWIALPVGVHQLAGTLLIATGAPIARAVCDALGLVTLLVFLLAQFTSSGVAGLAVACIFAESITAGLMIAAFLSNSRSHGKIRKVQ